VWNDGGADFNLTQLIESVEKDIRALEDMERGRSGGGAGLPRLAPLPPLTAATSIDTLPGYRPSKNKPSEPIYLHHSVLSPPPPLPPKKKHLPPKKVVSNAAYGRRPLRPIGSSDDVFTASLVKAEDDSLLAVRDRVRALAAHLSRDGRGKRALPCPFCASVHGAGAPLESHLLSAHSDELERIASNMKAGFSSLQMFNCPYCGSGFAKAQAAIRHLRYQHEEESRGVLLRNILASGGKCRFCPKEFRPSHHRLALLHAEQEHNRELAEILFGKNASSKKPPLPCPPRTLPPTTLKLRDTSSLSEDHQFLPAPATEASHFYHEIPDQVSDFKSSVPVSQSNFAARSQRGGRKAACDQHSQTSSQRRRMLQRPSPRRGGGGRE